MSIKLIDNENLLHKNAAVSMYMQGVQQSLNDPNQGMGLTDTEKMFKDQFVQIAQETFLSKAKKYADKVEDFIVLDVIPEKNYGFGAFMLNLGEPEDTVYVPIIMQNSQIKPILMMFNDTFDLLPFTAEWVDYIQQNRAERIIESVNDVNDSWNSATGRSNKGRSLYPTSASEINVRGITQPPNLITNSGAVGMATGPFDVDHPRNSQTFTQVLNPVFENFDRLAKRASDSNENGKIKVDLAIQDMEERVNTVMRIIKSAAINVPGSNSNLNTSILSRVEKKKSSEEAEKILSELTSENDNDTVKMFLDQMRSNSNFLRNSAADDHNLINSFNSEAQRNLNETDSSNPLVNFIKQVMQENVYKEDTKRQKFAAMCNFLNVTPANIITNIDDKEILEKLSADEFGEYLSQGAIVKNKNYVINEPVELVNKETVNTDKYKLATEGYFKGILLNKKKKGVKCMLYAYKPESNSFKHTARQVYGVDDNQKSFRGIKLYFFGVIDNKLVCGETADLFVLNHEVISENEFLEEVKKFTSKKVIPAVHTDVYRNNRTLYQDTKQRFVLFENKKKRIGIIEREVSSKKEINWNYYYKDRNKIILESYYISGVICDEKLNDINHIVYNIKDKVLTVEDDKHNNFIEEYEVESYLGDAEVISFADYGIKVENLYNIVEDMHKSFKNSSIFEVNTLEKAGNDKYYIEEEQRIYSEDELFLKLANLGYSNKALFTVFNILEKRAMALVHPKQDIMKKLAKGVADSVSYFYEELKERIDPKNNNIMAKCAADLTDSNTSIKSKYIDSLSSFINLSSAKVDDGSLPSLLNEYIPELIKSVNLVGRVTLLIQLSENELIKYFGVDKVKNLEDNFSRIFKTLGAAAIEVNKQVNSLEMNLQIM